MPKIISTFLILLLLPTSAVHALCNVSWDQIIDTEAEHTECQNETNNPHFTTAWHSTGGWNGTEGFYRWTVAYTVGEDDDGYTFDHPNTASNSVWISFIFRVGSTWWAHHTSGDRFKLVMFYNTAETNPRPTMFNAPVFNGSSVYSYRSWGPDVSAGGSGVDEFGETNFGANYPNHTYQENSSGHSQWYFAAVGLDNNVVKVYLWTQDGTKNGELYATSQTDSWAVTWHYVRLLAYIEATTEGDANSYMDISHVSVHQTLPSPPAGFVGSTEQTISGGIDLKGASLQ